MFIAVTIKRYPAIKEAGKIKMIVGVIAYYQLVQVCQVNLFFLPVDFFIMLFYCVIYGFI